LIFPAAREGDPATHDLLVPSGVIGPPPTGPCPQRPVLIEGLPAAHVFCSVICSGAMSFGVAHPPPPPGPPPPPIVSGSPTVLIHGVPAARWAPSGDTAACGGFLGSPPQAPTRTVFIGGAAQPPGSSLALARALVKTGGKAILADAELVVQQYKRVPPAALKLLLKNKTKVVACRGSVTDHLADLRGVHPRGWPHGATWDSVPGLNAPDRNEVVIATIGHGTKEGPHVPRTGEGHGSSSVVVHETFHAVDKAGGRARSSSDEFVTAKQADAPSLSPYESQAGAAGREETYAESAARYYSADADDAADHPNLHAYWQGDPIADKAAR
jgi:uncharacterized Zn-binding protein involved in type VI secretion